MEASTEQDFPRPCADVSDSEIVAVLMPRRLARCFERRCLPVAAQLIGPLEFGEEDVPTFIIEIGNDEQRKEC